MRPVPSTSQKSSGWATAPKTRLRWRKKRMRSRRASTETVASAALRKLVPRDGDEGVGQIGRVQGHAAQAPLGERLDDARDELVAARVLDVHRAVDEIA